MHRPAPLPWIPAFAGTTMGALARGVRVRVGDAPPRAPALDSRFRGNDDGGVGARGSCQGGRCTAPRPCPGFPLSRERRWGRWREGFVSGWGMHRPAPLPWIPAFAGTTMGALARGVRVRVGDAPPRAPALDSRFRGNDDGGVGARGSCQGGGCTASRPCPGFPAFAGTTMGECGFGKGACRGVAGSGDGKAALRTGPSTGSGRTDSGRPPSGHALREPQGGLRANGFGEREACDGI